jgi:release factor glutamine methyltransferase
MAYILGEREFWGLAFKVTPDVLVPRPDSETMIEAALALLPDRARPWRLLDLGTGSGCLLLTLLREFPNASGVGLDASPRALDVARANARDLSVADRATLIAGDWREPDWTAALPGAPFDLVVSNPPYIEAAAIDGLMPEVARFEPRLALDGGADGLAAYRRIATDGPKIVTRGGFLAVEGGEGQVSDIIDIFLASGFVSLPPWKDLGGIERVIAARH